MRFALVARFHLNFERVRFDNDAITHQIVLTRCEFEGIDDIAETVKSNDQVYSCGIDGLAVLVWIDTVLRRHPGFEDGHLQRERSVFQQPSTIWTARIFFF